MGELKKNLGIVFVLIGVILLCVYYFGGFDGQNWFLTASAGSMIVGLILHIYLNKKE